MDNILVIGAHPDDIELGCGGTVSKHIELGNKVYALIMTKGEKGGHPPGMGECILSLKSLGIRESDIIFGDFPDGFLRDDLEVVNFIEKTINNLDISVVYTHYSEDRHQDHDNCSKAVSAAARKTPSLFLFEGPSTKIIFEPHYFVELSEENLNKKIDSLSNYKSQIEKGIIDLGLIKSVARVNGGRCNTKYAEAFALNHLFIGGKNV